MKFYILLLPIILISNSSHATTSPEIIDLNTSALQEYRKGNYDTAITLYKKSASLGSPLAMKTLSSIYKYGKVPKDDDLSNKYLQDATVIYEKYAEGGDADAQYNLGLIYASRTTPSNKLEAYNWFLKAANNGHMKAQYAVGQFLERGTLDQKVKKNPEEAIKWFEESAKQGYEPAIKALAKFNAAQSEPVQSNPEQNKRVIILWSTKEKCFEEGAFMIAIETDGNTYKVAACAKYGCRIAINEFGKNAYKGDYKDEPKFTWHSDKEFETKINGNNMRFYHCLTK